MILEEWNNKAFVSAWIKATGEYGDFYRKTLINSILAGALDAQESDLEEGFFHHALTKFHLSEECPIVSTGSPRLEESKCKQWMAAYPKNSGDNKVRILDLGCGEGYRGRWLTPKGFTYLGID
jgi:2-polyprenyl-3-methyl-5-hydroxy-6-metoxy-1,4-benzoquinol methylase